MDFSLLATSGVLMGIIVFALKISVGCGLASLSRKEVLTVAIGYLALSLIIGLVLGKITDEALASVLNLGVAMHVIMALLLVVVGVITAREWNWHLKDVSRKTFWIISMPCPACMAAIFLSCGILFDLLDVASWKIGAFVGLIFFVTIIIFSTVIGRIGKAPATLGNSMIFFGLFYLLSILIIPAYLKSQSTPFVPVTIPLSDLFTSYSFILALIVLGYACRKMEVLSL